MNEKLRKAIQNNNDLYKAIFKPHQIESHHNSSIWYYLEKTPPLYSNLVTLSEDWKPDEIFRQIDATYGVENWEEWSIKDSFQTLNLIEYGFKKLFDAKWLYLEVENFKPIQSDKKLNYKIVESEEILADWRKAWDTNENLGKEIFKPKLLDDPKVRFIAGFEEQNLISGCFINETEHVLGISNFFAPDESIEYWSGLVEFIFASFNFADIIGYERDDLAKELQLLGFETIGDLTVWLKN